MSSSLHYRRSGSGREIWRDGLRLDVPQRWEGRISRKVVAERGGHGYPVLHAATVPLPVDRADYGGGVVEQLRSGDVFVALVEFGPEQAGTALFPVVDELPRVDLGMFHRNQLQRRIRGQAGVQRFFTLHGRPFCLYVVLGAIANGPALVAEANHVLQNLTVEPV